MVRIALPIKNETLSDSFEHCTYYVVFEYDNCKGFAEIMRISNTHSIKANLLWLHDFNVTDVIANVMEKALLNYLSDTKINLFVGVEIKPPELLIQEYERGVLKSNLGLVQN